MCLRVAPFNVGAYFDFLDSYFVFEPFYVGYYWCYKESSKVIVLGGWASYVIIYKVNVFGLLMNMCMLWGCFAYWLVLAI